MDWVIWPGEQLSHFPFFSQSPSLSVLPCRSPPLTLHPQSPPYSTLYTIFYFIYIFFFVFHLLSAGFNQVPRPSKTRFPQQNEVTRRWWFPKTLIGCSSILSTGEGASLPASRFNLLRVLGVSDSWPRNRHRTRVIRVVVAPPKWRNIRQWRLSHNMAKFLRFIIVGGL